MLMHLKSDVKCALANDAGLRMKRDMKDQMTFTMISTILGGLLNARPEHQWGDELCRPLVEAVRRFKEAVNLSSEEYNCEDDFWPEDP